MAEDTGLIVEIGEWVLNTACAAAMAWPAGVRIAVNLSPVQFKDRRLVETVKNALARSGLPAQRLELEITETVVLQEDQVNRVALQELGAPGISIALDDFGIGYSSLSYLRAFPFSKIKIDQSFVRELGDKSDGAPIVRAIADLGAALALRRLPKASKRRRSSGSCVRPVARKRKAFCSAARFRHRRCRP